VFDYVRNLPEQKFEDEDDFIDFVNGIFKDRVTPIMKDYFPEKSIFYKEY